MALARVRGRRSGPERGSIQVVDFMAPPRRLDQATLFYIEAVPLLVAAFLCAWMNRGALRRAASGHP